MTVTPDQLQAAKNEIIASFNRRLEQHEKLQNLIHKNTNKILERHEKVLFGESGRNGISGDVKSFRTGINIVSILLTGGILIIAYSAFVGSP